ncbi:hypothetical protein [Methylobacterium sp. WSM2598]|uniref:hypothetical protein n=1 Tax=Methylobacterium sp. WSM2598 TaxID=398261 RepID=UPI0003791C7B|nr:hypothetical protein [Methylobacterium sp. WSM2598]
MQWPALVVIVRAASGICASRQGSDRLARLAEKDGADTPLERVLEGVAHDCPYPPPDRVRGNAYVARRHAGFPDLTGPPKPPVLPPARWVGPGHVRQ